MKKGGSLMKNYRFTIGIDCDDVLLPCCIQAVDWANRDYHFDPPLAIDEITSWNVGGRGSVIYDYFKKREFFEAQEPLPGAQEFLRKLSRKGELFCVTAVEPEFMDIRIKQIIKFFPQIKKENIIPAYRKDLIKLDFLLDDGAHNILNSTAKFPVLLRRPWNKNITGALSVNNYDEFLNIVDCIKKSYAENDMYFAFPAVIALVGPSGSGKTAIATELLKSDRFEKIKSTTTRQRRTNEQEDAYNFITEEEFKRKLQNGEFVEHTVYSNNFYGTEIKEVENILNKDKHCVLPIDITGAMALKMKYRTAIFFIDRNRNSIINALLLRVLNGECQKEEIVNRIDSIEREFINKEFADYIINNDGDLENAVNEILKITKS